MSTSKERVLQRERDRGRIDALDLQDRSPSLSGTELNAEDSKIPNFKMAVATANMLTRKAGQTDGFVCKSSAGRVVRLIQNYDSDTYTQEPELLDAQWRFVWSTDPKKALPFIALSTSPFNTGECCTHIGHVWRSGQDGNIWAPGTINIAWEDLGTVEEVIGG